MTDSMLPVTPAIGGEDDLAPMSAPFDVSSWMVDRGDRNSRSDCRTISDVAGMDDESASVDKDNSGYLIVTKGASLMHEKRSGGWTRYTEPVGAIPRAVNTNGTRGASDIGRI